LRKNVAKKYYNTCNTAILTSCCSTDSERPHRCCHLPIMAENIDRTPDIPYTFHFPQKLSLPWGIRSLNIVHPSPYSKWHLDRFSRLCRTHVVINTQRDTQTTLHKVSKLNYTGIAVRNVTLPHRYGNSHAICDNTVLPATRQSDIPAEVGTRLGDHGRMQGFVDLVGWYTRPQIVTSVTTGRVLCFV